MYGKKKDISLRDKPETKMREISGVDFYTTSGRMVILDEPTEGIAVGEYVWYKGEVYKILSLVPSSRPNGKWSVRIQ